MHEQKRPAETGARGRRRLATLVGGGWLVLLFWGLSSCAPPSGPTIRLTGIGTAVFDPKPAPRFTGSEFIAADGARLPLRIWLPAGPVKAVILALHGFNDYSRAFAAPGKAWASDGIATYAYDQRGFGAAPERGLWPGRAALAADAATACKVLRRRYPG
ncbi:MAG TPA: alpha/beta hydrolase, partial [Stellaceae bacterium]|nr:alpha/beta hydrolase [Stellaceae bacterium]